jgi:hypothetical protein
MVHRLALWRCPRARTQSDPVAAPGRSSRSGSPSGTVRARLCQQRCRRRRSPAMRLRGLRGGTAFVYFPKRFYAYWAQPGYTACYPGPENCYWRRDCWYDSFGRRFCN